LAQKHEKALVSENVVVSHQTVFEGFVAMVLEKFDGNNARRDAFVASLGNHGFGLLEGVKMKIQLNNEGEKVLHIDFDSFEKEGIPPFSFHEDIPWNIVEHIAKLPDPLDEKQTEE